MQTYNKQTNIHTHTHMQHTHIHTYTHEYVYTYIHTYTHTYIHTGGKQDQYWADTAMQKLPALMDASNMLVCGEDLGMIPACVAGVLEKLVIMGLRIQRMPPPSKLIHDIIYIYI